MCVGNGLAGPVYRSGFGFDSLRLFPNICYLSLRGCFLYLSLRDYVVRFLLISFSKPVASPASPATSPFVRYPSGHFFVRECPLD